MRRSRSILPAIVLIFLSGGLVAASCNDKPGGKTHMVKTQEVVKMKPTTKVSTGPAFSSQVAGRFYPGEPHELRRELGRYLTASEKLPGDLLGIFVPHAGTPYSGPVAGPAFAQLRDRGFTRVVVLGTAHRRAFAKPAILTASGYQTPLGDILIDAKGVQQLLAKEAVVADEDKFRGEHALEVELPFLQLVLGSDFQLVPIMISGADAASARKLAKVLKETFPGRDTVFVASTDMSHDFPYDVATAMDEHAVRLVGSLDTEALAQAYARFRLAGKKIALDEKGKLQPDCAQLCGMGPVLTLMELAKLQSGAKVEVLDRRNSGDIVGNKKSRIVGYFSAAVLLAEARPKVASVANDGDFLTPAEKNELLQIARKTLEIHLRDGSKPDFQPKNKKLLEPGAAFVTLKNRGRLRGCIGYMEPIEPLWEMIRNRAMDAATHDRRFKSVTAEELKEIHIEISVLSPRVKVSDPLREIKVGRDGVWIQVGMHRGVFLPQVPVEQNWTTVEEYLTNLCRKAHVPDRNCWRSDEAELQRFTALVFSEKE